MTLLIVSLAIPRWGYYEYEQDLNNPNQNLSPVDLNYQDMGNLDNVIPPDFNSDPFPDPNMNPLDPFSRRTQVC
mgnify:CR=1 FL=1